MLGIEHNHPHYKAHCVGATIWPCTALTPKVVPRLHITPSMAEMLRERPESEFLLCFFLPM